MLHSRESLIENHRRFVSRVIEGEIIWGLDQGNGFAWCESHETPSNSVILFWSDKAYANRAQKSRPDCVVSSVSLFDFLFRWLPGMQGDGALAGCNWTEDLAGIEVDAGELQSEIATAMADEMISQYQEELQRQIDNQK